MIEAAPTVTPISVAICGSSESGARTIAWLAKPASASSAMARVGVDGAGDGRGPAPNVESYHAVVARDRAGIESKRFMERIGTRYLRTAAAVDASRSRIYFGPWRSSACSAIAFPAAQPSVVLSKMHQTSPAFGCVIRCA